MKIEYSEAEIRQIIIGRSAEMLGAVVEELSCEIVVHDMYGTPINPARYVKAVVTLPEQV